MQSSDTCLSDWKQERVMEACLEENKLSGSVSTSGEFIYGLQARGGSFPLSRGDGLLLLFKKI